MFDAQLRLPGFFSNHMILQRERPVPVWGWAKPGVPVSVKLSEENQAETRTGADGSWSVMLSPEPTAAVRQLTVTAEKTIVIDDIVFGDLWLASGQSNMEWVLVASEHGREELKALGDPLIRSINVPREKATTPAADFDAEWQRCTPETAWSWSAVGYYFAKEIHQKTQVPIGLINASWGGTPAEVWTPVQALENNPKLSHLLDPASYGNYGMDFWPGCLYNAMVAPLLRLPLTGYLWYQGESNVGRAHEYQELFTTMIQAWRDEWHDSPRPFYFVQIAPFNYLRDESAQPGQAPALRDAQRRSLCEPASGMAVISDIGNIEDIHPTNKRDVGKRLALWALNDIYEQPCQASGPLFRECIAEGDQLRVRFDAVGEGLATSDGNAPNWFELSGDGEHWIEAEAVIDGDDVLVHAASLKAPTAVRMGWKDVAEPNLVNRAGLPASTFTSVDPA